MKIGEVSGRKQTRRLSRLLARTCAAALVAFTVAGQAQVAAAEERSLSLYNAHTKELATIVYKRDGQYDRAGLTKLNHFLRDWRKNKPISMDPKLYDMLWEAYDKTGATRPITVICGYRSPETNAELRRRSKGVAQNSQHTKGKAIDFYIPGVDLATLRAVGLRLQAGGVGFYPTSGSPFVHMDTGSVRHWPRMSRSQLVKVFPNGGTLHVPTDGKPLPGYAQALAAYKLRQARGVAVASISGVETPTVVAAADIPLPRTAPRAGPTVETGVAMATAAGIEEPVSATSPLLSYPPKPGEAIDAERFTERFAAAEEPAPTGLDPMAVTILAAAFDTAHEMPAPSAPADLLAAMARHRQPEPSNSATASLPIQPTSVVATVDVGVDLSRPLRADAITTAVLRGNQNDDRLLRPAQPILAYASPAIDQAPDETVTTGGIASTGVPLPQSNPIRVIGTDSAAAAPAASAPAVVAPQRSASAVYKRLFPADLTLTKLDTQGLRLWIATPSTREKRYALLTMPDFGQMAPSLLGKPDTAFAARFGRQFNSGLRTDRFDGAVILSPAIVDLTTNQIIAAR